MLQAFQNYPPCKLNLNCEIVRENLYAIFAHLNNSSNCKKSQILFLARKIYTRWRFWFLIELLNWLIYVKRVAENACWSLTPFFPENPENFSFFPLTNSEIPSKIALFKNNVDRLPYELLSTTEMKQNKISAINWLPPKNLLLLQFISCLN